MFRVQGFWFRVSGAGLSRFGFRHFVYRVQRFWVSGFGFRGSGFRVQGSGLHVAGFVFRVLNFEFRGGRVPACGLAPCTVSEFLKSGSGFHVFSDWFGAHVRGGGVGGLGYGS